MKKKKCAFLTADRGLFYAYPPSYEAVLVDPNYNGLKVVYKEKTAPKILSNHNTGFVSDCIEAISPLDGKMYTSKSKYYQALKDSGNHIVEAGEHGNKQEIRGDYNLRPELNQAIQRHLH